MCQQPLELTARSLWAHYTTGLTIPGCFYFCPPSIQLYPKESPWFSSRVVPCSLGHFVPFFLRGLPFFPQTSLCTRTICLHARRALKPRLLALFLLVSSLSPPLSPFGLIVSRPYVTLF